MARFGPSDDEGLARKLGISREAIEILRASEFIDLHTDVFIPMRIFGYDVHRRHERSLLGGRFFGHLDVPRILEAGLGGAMWSITTNPFRTASGRWRAFRDNVARLESFVQATNGALAIVRTHREFVNARARGAHACLLAVQGGNSFDAMPEGIVHADRVVTRVTLVHLTNSVLGTTNNPLSRLRRHRGLTPRGKDFVALLNAHRVFVDLAHLHRDGFWDAVRVHDRTQPLLVTHTGVAGVMPHWRNIDDAQLRAIAKTSGVVGIMASPTFLETRATGPSARMLIAHMEHVIRVVGDDFVGVGTDFDGAILPPRDFCGAACYPRLVHYMLERGWTEERIRKILAGNFLRAFEILRPG